MYVYGMYLYLVCEYDEKANWFFIIATYSYILLQQIYLSLNVQLLDEMWFKINLDTFFMSYAITAAILGGLLAPLSIQV